jgi:hypothetical protein
VQPPSLNWRADSEADWTEVVAEETAAEKGGGGGGQGLCGRWRTAARALSPRRATTTELGFRIIGGGRPLPMIEEVVGAAVGMATT